MEILIFWLLCGGIAAYLYQQKGRSVGVGLVGGFLLGPLGIVLVLISSSTLAKCPHCAEKIKPEAKVCKYCHRELQDGWSAGQINKRTWVGPLVLAGVLLFIFLVFIGPFLMLWLFN